MKTRDRYKHTERDEIDAGDRQKKAYRKNKPLEEKPLEVDIKERE
jgi:hypothetical protein